MGTKEEHPYELLVSCPNGIPRSQLSVDFSSIYDRVPHPNAALEAFIEEEWGKRVDANSSLFNATKFRYGGCKIFMEQDGECVPSSVCLCLGLTDYKTFVGTNLSSNWEAFLNSTGDRCKHTASPLGNGAVVETKDNKVIILQRSHKVGEFPGHLVFPGGHSEPNEVGVCGHLQNCVPVEKQAINSKIANEMFDGIIREVVEETGVPPHYLGDPLFIGVSLRSMNVRPTAFFHMKCSLPAAEVLDLYKDAEHSFESTQLHLISLEELMVATQKMPGCHQGGAALFHHMLNTSSKYS